MKIAIVILNWNGRNMLKRFLPILQSNLIADSVVFVADNASSDDSLQLLKSDFPDVRVIELDKNYGFADGYNKALQQIDAEYYLLLNSDVEVTSDWVEPMLWFMEANHHASLKFSPSPIVIVSSMRVLVADSLISMVIPIVVAVYLIR